MSIISEFREFAIKGNVVDMAVGVIVGAAFGGIVKSLVEDVMMPPLGLLLGNMDFSNLFLVLHDGVKAAAPYHSLNDAIQAGATVLKYGVFVNTLVNFLIVSFAIFMVVKQVNNLKKKNAEAPAAPAPTPEDIVLLREIRDSLKQSA
jgi:large conductance mechanosensitive channel